MKPWTALSLLVLVGASSSIGCQLIAGIDSATLEAEGGTDATVAIETGGGSDGMVGEDAGAEDASAEDAGRDAEDAGGDAEDAGLATQDGATVDGGRPLGTSCTGDGGGGCASGFCVDGVCCASACTGQCEACNQPDAGGACGPPSALDLRAREPGPYAAVAAPRATLLGARIRARRLPAAHRVAATGRLLRVRIATAREVVPRQQPWLVATPTRATLRVRDARTLAPLIPNAQARHPTATAARASRPRRTA
jgi:hypothetical protein